MRRSMIAAAFAAMASAGLCTGANAVPAGPSVPMAQATETSVTQVYLRHRGVYRSRVYGYRHAGVYRSRVYGYRHAGHYRARVLRLPSRRLLPPEGLWLLQLLPPKGLWLLQPACLRISGFSWLRVVARRVKSCGRTKDVGCSSHDPEDQTEK